MAGLLDGVLPYLYSQSDRLKRNFSGLLSDPKGSFEQTAGLLQDSSRNLQALLDRAQAGDKKAQGDAAEQMLGGLLGFAPVGMTKVVGPQSAALETARKNAVKMLGLPEGNTAAQRAQALGFNTPAFHGTKGDLSQGGIAAFDPSMALPGLYGKGVYTTSSPAIAGGGKGNTIAPQGYATNEALNKLISREQEAGAELKQVMQTLDSARTAGDANKVGIFEDWARGLQGDLRNMGQTQTGGGAVYPLNVRNQNPFNPDNMKLKRGDLPKDMVSMIEDSMHSVGKNPKGKWPLSYDMLSSTVGGQDAANEVLKQLGYSGVKHAGGAVTGVPIKHSVDVLFNPNQVRSRFAAFDPARVHENDLLGLADPYLLGLIASGALGGSYMAGNR